MTAAKIMDIISRLFVCDRQAANAALTYTQMKMEDVHKLLKNPKSECPDIWIRPPRHKWPNHCPIWITQLLHLIEICTTFFWKDCSGKWHLRKYY